MGDGDAGGSVCSQPGRDSRLRTCGPLTAEPPLPYSLDEAPTATPAPCCWVTGAVAGSAVATAARGAETAEKRSVSAWQLGRRAAARVVATMRMKRIEGLPAMFCTLAKVDGQKPFNLPPPRGGPAGAAIIRSRGTLRATEPAEQGVSGSVSAALDAVLPGANSDPHCLGQTASLSIVAGCTRTNLAEGGLVAHTPSASLSFGICPLRSSPLSLETSSGGASYSFPLRPIPHTGGRPTQQHVPLLRLRRRCPAAAHRVTRPCSVAAC